MLRYSPGTCCQAALRRGRRSRPYDRARSARGRCPSDSRASSRSRSGPSRRLHADGGAQVHVLRLEALGAHLLPPVDVVRQPLSSARCRRLSSERFTLFGILSLVTAFVMLVSPSVRSGAVGVELWTGLLAVQGERALLADGVRALEDPVLPGLRRPKILVSMVSGPAKRRFCSMPVSASGEKPRALRSRCGPRRPSRCSSGARVTKPSLSAVSVSRSAGRWPGSPPAGVPRKRV
jgi:hypothetical protein